MPCGNSFDTWWDRLVWVPDFVDGGSRDGFLAPVGAAITEVVIVVVSVVGVVVVMMLCFSVFCVHTHSFFENKM
jgi:hypothetical protein